MATVNKILRRSTLVAVSIIVILVYLEVITLIILAFEQGH